MFETLFSQIGAGFTVLVVAFAFLKGDEPEKVGAGAYVLGFLTSLLLQHDTRDLTLDLGLLLVDVVMLGVFGALAWKSRRAWPIWVSALQALVVCAHILKLLQVQTSLTAIVAVINLSSYAILIALAVGTFWAWQERRAAGVE